MKQNMEANNHATSLGLLEYNCSWERISRLHTAHVLHMYYTCTTSRPSDPSPLSADTDVVLVASASARRARRTDGDSGPQTSAGSGAMRGPVVSESTH